MTEAAATTESWTARAGRAGGAAVDGAILGLMKRASGQPSGLDYHRLRHEVTTAADLYRRRGYLDDPTAFHPVPPPLTTYDLRRRWIPGLPRFEQISFDSGYVPDPDDRVGDRWQALRTNHVAHAYVLRQRGGTPRPWLICLHGLGTGHPVADFPTFRARRLHRRLGLNLLFPVLPLHGARRPHGMPREALLSFELVQTVHGFAQAVWDIRRLLHWVRAQGGTRVGVYGVSIGSAIAALVAGLEDLELALAGIPLADVPSLFLGHAGRRTRKRARSHGLGDAPIRELYRVIAPASLPPRVPPARRAIYAARGDLITRPVQARLLWEAWGRPTIAWLDAGHVTTLATAAAQRFVEHTLAGAGLSLARSTP